MPCRYYTAEEESDIRAKELDKLTRLLCRACVLLAASNYKNKMGGELSEWWESHKEMDAARLAHEKAERDNETIRKQALKKLTKKERAVLRV